MKYEILLLARLTSSLPRKSNARLAGLILVNHCAEQNSSQIRGVCPPPPGEGVGCFGIEWYVVIKYQEKILDIPNLIRATIFCPLAFRLIVVQLSVYALKIEQACLIDMARFFAFLLTDTKSRSMTPPPSPPPKKIMNNDDELYCICRLKTRKNIFFLKCRKFQPRYSNEYILIKKRVY